MAAIDLSKLSLFPATAEQLWESRRRTAVQWCGRKTIEQYLERDRIMDLHEHARDGRLITWVLAPRDDPSTLDFMCSCEVFRRIGVVAQPTSGGQVVVKEVPCYGIASVYTHPSKRKKGYAAHMLGLLHWIFAPEGSFPTQFPPEWGSPPVARFQDAVFSALYSDVGSKFYHVNCSCLPGRNLGWIATGAISTTWKARSMTADNTQWRSLTREDVIDVWDKDIPKMKEDAAKLAGEGTIACTFLPNGGWGLFSIDRVMRFDEGLRPILPLDTWGVQLVRSSEDDPLIYATWTLENSHSNVMVITRLRSSAQLFPSLLAKIMEVAIKYGLQAVETWNLPHELASVAKELGGETFERKEHLSSIRWYGENVEDDVRWIFNEKFCWC